MWWLSRSKSRFLKNVERNRYHDFLSRYDLIPIPWRDRPGGTGDWRRRSQNGFCTPASSIILSVGEFIFSTPNIGAKKSKLNRRRLIYKKSNWNREKKTTIVTWLQFLPYWFHCGMQNSCVCSQSHLWSTFTLCAVHCAARKITDAPKTWLNCVNAPAHFSEFTVWL